MKITEQFGSTMSADILAAAIAALPGGEQALQDAADAAVIAALEGEANV